MQSISNPSERDALNELKTKYKLKDDEYEVDRQGRVRKLNLYFKELRGIPKEIKNFKNLQELDLGYNEIPKIEGLNELKSLKKLTLEYNKIKRIEGLHGLNHLEIINLFGNSIQKINGLEDLDSLKKLDLGKNPLSPEDAKILKKGGAKTAVTYCKSVKSVSILKELKEEFGFWELATPKDVEFVISELEKRNIEMEPRDVVIVPKSLF